MAKSKARHRDAINKQKGQRSYAVVLGPVYTRFVIYCAWLDCERMQTSYVNNTIYAFVKPKRRCQMNYSVAWRGMELMAHRLFDAIQRTTAA